MPRYGIKNKKNRFGYRSVILGNEAQRVEPLKPLKAFKILFMLTCMP